MTCGRGSYVRDLEPMLAACFRHKIRVLISSVDGDGSRKHVAEMLAIVTEISHRKRYSFKVATIDAGMNRDFTKSRIILSKVSPVVPLSPCPPRWWTALSTSLPRWGLSLTSRPSKATLTSFSGAVHTTLLPLPPFPCTIVCHLMRPSIWARLWSAAVSAPSPRAAP